MIRTSTGPAHTRILGIGAHTPSRIITNDEVCTWIESSDEWITTRSGIKERTWATEDETILAMATQASRTALERAGVDAAQVGAVIVATVSHFHQTPGIAPQIALAVGAADAAAYDISAACAGFCYAVTQGDALVRSGACEYALVIGVERLSDLTDQTDRSTAFIFADGAGAAVIGPSDTPGIGPAVWGSDATKHDLIVQSVDWESALETGEHPAIVMDGNPVFKWASFEMAKKAKEALDAAGLSPSDIDVFVPHQANDRITQAMARTLGLSPDVTIARNIAHCGNASSASIPMALDALYADGSVSSGQTCLMIGFGAGLVYAGQVVVLP